MKQKGQAKQNTKKELKEMLNWTSSVETVAPDAPVTLHWANRLASDTPVLYHSGMGRAMPRLREKSKVAPVTPVVLI